MSIMKKSLFYIIFALVCLSAFITIWLNFLWWPTVEQAQGYTYYLRPGISKRVLITQLTQQGIIKHEHLFSLYVYLHKNNQLKTGEYFFANGATPISIWKQITTGTGLLYRPFTIIPGWSFVQLKHALSQVPGLKHLTAKLNDNQIMAHLGAGALAPEGEFFPETYLYTKGISDLVILKRAFDLMQSRLKTAWLNRAPALPYTNDYEALIAASLIEKEAYLSLERPIIAGVLVNRLRKEMLLQFDPSVIYGLGERYHGKIYKENLQEDTVYNTYIHKGLPPTPIAMPSESAIQAALHPTQHDYYYFVSNGNGSHHFSKSLVEHQAAVNATFKMRAGFFNDVLVRHHMESLMEQNVQKP